MAAYQEASESLLIIYNVHQILQIRKNISKIVSASVQVPKNLQIASMSHIRYKTGTNKLRKTKKGLICKEIIQVQCSGWCLSVYNQGILRWTWSLKGNFLSFILEQRQQVYQKIGLQSPWDTSSLSYKIYQISDIQFKICSWERLFKILCIALYELGSEIHEHWS